MPTKLPPLRLTGATVLRDGAMQQRTVAVADGRISAGPYPAVDLSGYYILPGIVDLSSDALVRHMDNCDPGAALRAADTDLAAAGITTGWLRQIWGWSRPGEHPHAAEALLRQLKQHATSVDMRAQLQVEVLLSSSARQLSAVIAQKLVDFVVFSNDMSRKLAWADTAPGDFAQWAKARGGDPAVLLATLRDAHDRRNDMPRRLCSLAESFDDLGILYGSHGDADGETREMYSILGAKLCMTPAAHPAAAVAQAVGDPTIMPAATVVQPQTGGINTPALIRAGKCAALCSAGYAPSLVQAAFELDAAGICSFAKAWAMISTVPAAIMRLPDRGVIAPGKRADLTIVNPRTRQVEGTISKGRPVYLAGDLVGRFIGADHALGLAAE